MKHILLDPLNGASFCPRQSNFIYQNQATEGSGECDPSALLASSYMLPVFRNCLQYFKGRRAHWPRCLKSRSTAARLLRFWVRIPPGAWMSVCCECCQRSLRRADHLSRGFLPTVVRRCVRSRNLVVEEVVAQSGAVAKKKKIEGAVQLRAYSQHNQQSCQLCQHDSYVSSAGCNFC